MSEKRQWLTVAVMISAYTCAVLTQAKEFVPATYGATAGAAQWSLAFDADGQVTVSRDGETAVQGTYDVSGGELEVIDQKGPMACPPDQTGRYKWSLDDETLTLTKVSDDCVGRSRAFTELAWTRKEQASAGGFALSFPRAPGIEATERSTEHAAATAVHRAEANSTRS